MQNIPNTMELSISEKVKAIVEDPTQEFPITGRELFNSLGFERRTSGNCWAVLRVAVLEEASKVPVYVSNSAPLVEATTLMRMNDYSQLPVTNNKLRGAMYSTLRTSKRHASNEKDK